MRRSSKVPCWYTLCTDSVQRVYTINRISLLEIPQGVLSKVSPFLRRNHIRHTFPFKISGLLKKEKICYLFCKRSTRALEKELEFVGEICGAKKLPHMQTICQDLGWKSQNFHWSLHFKNLLYWNLLCPEDSLPRISLLDEKRCLEKTRENGCPEVSNKSHQIPMSISQKVKRQQWSSFSSFGLILVIFTNFLSFEVLNFKVHHH